MKKIITLILIAITFAMAEKCPDFKYEGINKLANFNTINKWLEIPNPVNKYDIYVEFEETTAINVTGYFIGGAEITGDANGRKVIIAHKITVNDYGQLTRWMDRTVVTFVDENGIIDHEITVNYDMPKTIYRKLCR